MILSGPDDFRILNFGNRTYEQVKDQTSDNHEHRKDRHLSGERFHTFPAQPDTLGFLSLVVKAAGYTVHGEFVLCGMVGTSHLGRVDLLLANRTSCASVESWLF